MKTLNIITIAIMVPTLVVSAFSMNVTIPLQHHPAAFAIIMCFALLSVVLFMLFWRHRLVVERLRQWFSPPRPRGPIASARKRRWR